MVIVVHVFRLWGGIENKIHEEYVKCGKKTNRNE